MSDEGGLRNISDTAHWVAMYRALESERPDALFRDPFAMRLAGERGARIAEGHTFAQRNAWSFVARTVLFDRFISDAVAQGADMVVNLAAGLDARPYRMALPSHLAVDRSGSAGAPRLQDRTTCWRNAALQP
jgi:methyltransferase (TIGR00027 family)